MPTMRWTISTLLSLLAMTSLSHSTATAQEPEIVEERPSAQSPAGTPAASDTDAASSKAKTAATDAKPSVTKTENPTRAVAKDPTSDPEEADTTAVETPQLSADQKISDEVGRLAAAGPTSVKKLTKKEREAVKSYYAEGAHEPIWITEQGATERARKAVEEISKADDQGLRAADFATPDLTGVSDDVAAKAAAELKLTAAVLLYARHAKGGRVLPRQVGLQRTDQPRLIEPVKVLGDVANASGVQTYLRSLHPTHAHFVRLRDKLLELRGANNDTSRARIPSGPVLKRDSTHEHVALLRKRLSVSEPADDPKLFDEAVEKAVKDFQRKAGLTVDGVVGNGTRNAMNGDSNTSQVDKILINMERWRWLPDNLYGDAGIYVWANLPELRVRLVRDANETIFSERAIIGQSSHKTPVFSELLEWIEIHPTWFVPASIKVNDILPSLKRKTSTVMERYNLRVSCGSYGSNYKKIDWNSIDIRKCSFTQPPGPKSVLGDFKFKFPNRHSVYMHDTHKPGLFSSGLRMYSHGCIRVSKPQRMAELLVEHRKTMTAERLQEILKGPKVLHKAVFDHPVPVHITYFTATFDDDGNFKIARDVYGYDSRLTAILKGGNYGAAATPKTAKKKQKKKPKKQASSWWDGFFPAN